eukprot:g2449.t1
MSTFLVYCVSANESTCGADPTKVKNCENVDHGSCGNACCIVDYSFSKNTTAEDTYKILKGFLEKKGTDGSFAYVTGSDSAGHNPGDDLRPFNIPTGVQFIFQGTHTTTGGYVDTIDITISEKNGIITSRFGSRSGIHGAYGDGGQNYKTIFYMLQETLQVEDVDIVYGCGQ